MKKTLLSLLAIFLIIEEWLWDLLTAFGRSLSQWLNLQQFEQWLSQTTATMALVAFSIPILIVTPINLAAFGLLAKGLILQGILMEVLAKLLGTLLVARVFALTKPQLLTFTFLRITYTTVTRWLQWAHAKVTETAVYRWAKQLKG
ncbi:hypothetical protein [Methylobacter tundripaludum]|jgi:hypothetical protein|uniref:Uncharacterized protein n=2 Tax=Methylobacter tundripaludum TaxID=173365 RepID=G3IT14_METTV|nr:hypothetical protein [Methylobacter tundripaludum]EGW21298.1 hypothetical protein Mettu_0056 [Methylobacter tundripaludum SV96]PPK74386.1 hypothetical protein B0F87_10928 [Methylobacter tundripaludum]